MRSQPCARRWALPADEHERLHARPWTESLVAAFTARWPMLLARGLHPDDAEDVAETLALRDLDGDDRRACIECVHVRRAQGDRWGCAVGCGYGTDPAHLWRCPSYKPTTQPEGLTDD